MGKPYGIKKWNIIWNILGTHQEQKKIPPTWDEWPLVPPCVSTFGNA
jgi:hypothetical protein